VLGQHLRSTLPNIMSTTYIPGVCNIGPAEIRLRRQSGYIGLIVIVLMLVLFVLFHAPFWWRLLILLPAGVSSNGFLQAGMHFCAGFGMRGLFNFGDDTTKQETVEQAEYRRADRRKAMLILGYSLVISVIVFVIAVLLP
jgi:hypothetical protein